MPFPFKNFIPLEIGNAQGVSVAMMLAVYRRCFLYSGQDDKKIRFGSLTGSIKKGEKYIMVENGKPEYVVMHYDDYAELIERKNVENMNMVGDSSFGFPSEIKNVAIRNEDTFVPKAAFFGSNLPQDISKIRLEDLPL
ncbi:MAG: hypothetical protein Q7R91_02540 [bacterium]|nr:hypothetical protein [bacterium]